MDWAASGVKLFVKTGLKIAFKMGLNACQAGLGSTIELVLAAKCFREGNVCGGAICIVSGIADLWTLGLVGAAKEAMKESAKKSVIQFAKETAKTGSKEVSKKVGRQVGEELAKGVIPSAVEQVWSKGTKMTFEKFLQGTGLSAISSGGHQIGKTIFGNWVHTGITEALKRKSMEIAFDFTNEAAKQGASAEFLKQSVELFVKDSCIALAKGSIRSDPGAFEFLVGKHEPNLIHIEDFRKVLEPGPYNTIGPA